MRDIYTKSIRIDKAVAAIQRGEFVHFKNAADHYRCSRSAVSRRLRGLTKSKKQANSFWHQCLTIEQEEVLIHRINLLTDRGMLPTSHIVRNLAEEIRGKPVGKNWVGQFCRRHQIELKACICGTLIIYVSKANMAVCIKCFMIWLGAFSFSGYCSLTLL